MDEEQAKAAQDLMLQLLAVDAKARQNKTSLVELLVWAGRQHGYDLTPDPVEPEPEPEQVES